MEEQEKILEEIFCQSSEVVEPCEMKIDFRRIEARYVCKAIPEVNEFLCTRFYPTSSGKCGFRDSNYCLCQGV